MNQGVIEPVDPRQIVDRLAALTANQGDRCPLTDGVEERDEQVREVFAVAKPTLDHFSARSRHHRTSPVRERGVAGVLSDQVIRNFGPVAGGSGTAHPFYPRGRRICSSGGEPAHNAISDSVPIPPGGYPHVRPGRSIERQVGPGWLPIGQSGALPAIANPLGQRFATGIAGFTVGAAAPTQIAVCWYLDRQCHLARHRDWKSEESAFGERWSVVDHLLPQLDDGPLRHARQRSQQRPNIAKNRGRLRAWGLLLKGIRIQHELLAIGTHHSGTNRRSSLMLRLPGDDHTSMAGEILALKHPVDSPHAAAHPAGSVHHHPLTVKEHVQLGMSRRGPCRKQLDQLGSRTAQGLHEIVHHTSRSWC